MPPELKKRHVAAQHRKEQCPSVSTCGKFTAVHSSWVIAARVFVRLGTTKCPKNTRGTSLTLQRPSCGGHGASAFRRNGSEALRGLNCLSLRKTGS